VISLFVCKDLLFCLFILIEDGPRQRGHARSWSRDGGDKSGARLQVEVD